MSLKPLSVAVRAQDFSVDAENERLLRQSDNVGAVVNFVGTVRVTNAQAIVTSLELQHYPGMTENSICSVLQKAQQRWQLTAARVVHRIGRLAPADRIVYVGVASEHRHAAFEACAYIMDYLKLEAPFWKKEHTTSGSRWLDARETDAVAARRWSDRQIQKQE